MLKTCGEFVEPCLYRPVFLVEKTKDGGKTSRERVTETNTGGISIARTAQWRLVEIEKRTNIVPKRIGEGHMPLRKEFSLNDTRDVCPETFLHRREKLLVRYSMLTKKKLCKCPKKVIADEVVKNKTVFNESGVVFSPDDVLSKRN